MLGLTTRRVVAGSTRSNRVFRAWGAAVLAVAGLVGTTGASSASGPREKSPRRPAVLQAACHGTLVASTAGNVASNALTEISGVAASRRADDV